MITTFNNFIPEQDQIDLEKFLIGNEQFPYFHHIDTVGSYQEQTLIEDNNIILQPQFVHVLFHNGVVNSNAFEPIMSKFNFNSIGLKKYKFKRVKINLLTPSLHKTVGYHVPHFDSPNSSDISLIYYVNKSDGDTVIFNEKYTEPLTKYVSVKKKITPERGKILKFNSDQFHASSPPLKQDFRCIINMIFTLDSQ